ncbi:SMC-Scp complex subunit ScpB [Azospirillum sp. TSA2s]|uniref:SMC-Scp complex subunit ScpB n=1 Tax=Azospirillum sp. TSA2s TaxID=709810 RepID=UPI0010AAB43A|nr:SMC-Scp complex subunit ScpB [Azospirillum sp. TSA2s]QCG94475.1 SMC-Scp complex subunit ScpB [Azospirillum sp. TSA2s]
MARPRKVNLEARRAALVAELAKLPADFRHEESRRRLEAVLFAAAEPLDEAVLSRVLGPETDLRALLTEIQLRCDGLGFELLETPRGWMFRSRPAYGETILVARETETAGPSLSEAEVEVLTIIAYYQPITRGQIAAMRNRSLEKKAGEVRSEWVRRFLDVGWIAQGPRLATAGNPITYVTTPAFLDHFGLASLHDLPDWDRLVAAGLLSTEDKWGDAVESSLRTMLAKDGR